MRKRALRPRPMMRTLRSAFPLKRLMPPPMEDEDEDEDEDALVGEDSDSDSASDEPSRMRTRNHRKTSRKPTRGGGQN